MKVYEYLNQLKNTDVTLKVIKDWSHMNRILPCELEDHLELETPYPEVLRETQKRVCSEVNMNCYPDCWNKFFEADVVHIACH